MIVNTLEKIIDIGNSYTDKRIDQAFEDRKRIQQIETHYEQ